MVPKKKSFFSTVAEKLGLKKYISDFLSGRDLGGGGRRTILGADMNEEQALALSAFYACVTIIAESIASCPPELMKKDGLTPAVNEPEYLLFDTATNDNTTPNSFLESMMLDVCLHGNFYAEMVRDENGHVTALWPYAPLSVSTLRWGSSILFEVSSDGVGQPYPPGTRRRLLKGEDGFHWFRYSRNYVTGISPLRYHAELLALQRGQEEYQSTLFERGVMTKGMLKTPVAGADMSDEQIDDLRDQFADTYSGVKNGGSAIILPGGYDYVPISMSPADAELIQNYNLSERKIASIFKVPLFMLQNHEYSTFSNVEELGSQFVRFCLRHWSKHLLGNLNQQVLTESQRKRGLHFVQNFDDLTVGALKERFEALSNGVQGGWMLRSEARERANLANIKGMDEPLTPAALATDEERQARIEAIKAGKGSKNDPNNEEKPPKSVNTGDKSQQSAEKLATELFSDATRRFSVKVQAAMKSGKSAVQAVDEHWPWFKNQTKTVAEFVESDPEKRDARFVALKNNAYIMAHANHWVSALVLNSQE